jgi:hypothetical protein
MHQAEQAKAAAETPSPADPAAREQVLCHFAEWLTGAGPATGGTAADTPQARAGREVLAVLRRRNAPHGTRARRGHPRRAWRARLTLWVQEQLPGPSARRELAVATCDLSRGGFSFMSAENIAPGTTIFTRFENLPGRPCLRTTVCHCSRLATRLYRVGVKFLEVAEGPYKPTR